MASVELTRAVSTVYLVHPDDLPGPDAGLEQDALLSKTDVKEEIDANGQGWFLFEHADSKDLLNGQKVPIGLVSRENVEQVSVHNWTAFGFKTKDVASDQFIFHEDNNPLFKALCEELNGAKNDKNAPKPDVPGVSRLMHDTANHLKLSRWVYKHASEWGGEADYKKQVKDFLENGAQDSEDAKEMARRKYDRLEAKIANLSWWSEVSSKVKGFPSSPVVYHFNPAAFLEQMRRVEGGIRPPIDNPMLCLYSQNGNKKPWHGSFGNKIRDGVNKHCGVDLLAEPGTKVYASVESEVVSVRTSKTMAGHMLVLKVKDEESFKAMRKLNYSPVYRDNGELIDVNFNYEGPFYFVYMHLSKNDFFKVGDIVKPNDVIGLTGITGKNGVNFKTRNPHLHFEITNDWTVSGIELRCNPAVFFDFLSENELTANEIEFQNKLKEKLWE